MAEGKRLRRGKRGGSATMESKVADARYLFVFFLLSAEKVHLELRLMLPNDWQRQIQEPQKATKLHCLGLFLPKCSFENINSVDSFLTPILWLLRSRFNIEQQEGWSGRLCFYNPRDPDQGNTHLSVTGSALKQKDLPSLSSSPTLLKVTHPRRKHLRVDSNLKRVHYNGVLWQ